MSPLHHHRIPIPLLALPNLRSFPDSLPPFYLFLKRWSLTSNVTPTPTSYSDSLPRLTYSTIFSRLSTTILTFLEAVEPYLQRHPYTNIRFRFPSSPYLLHHLFPSFYHHFNVSSSGGALPPTSPLHRHQIPIPLLALPTPPSFLVFLPPF